VARPPDTIAETIVANCRPQPAIPAVLVLVLTLFYASARGGAVDVSVWSVAIVIGGLAVSCGLAIAAGFCSLFPPLVWIVVAALGLGPIGSMAGSGLARATVFVGMVAAAAMAVAQVWRVRTGRFSPTIADEPAEE
jgi:hypothetical protein